MSCPRRQHNVPSQHLNLDCSFKIILRSAKVTILSQHHVHCNTGHATINHLLTDYKRQDLEQQPTSHRLLAKLPFANWKLINIKFLVLAASLVQILWDLKDRKTPKTINWRRADYYFTLDLTYHKLCNLFLH